MLRLVNYLHGTFWLLLSWAIIALAILLTLARLLLPQLDLSGYRREIESVVQARAGMPLHIEAMNAEIQDAHLALRFSGISLLDPQTRSPRIQFREAHVQIDLLRSLLHGRLILGRGILMGGRLQVERHSDGSITVNGLHTGGDGSLLAPLLRRTELMIRDSEIHWQDLTTGAAPLRFTQVDANLFNSSVRHRLVVVAQVGHTGEQRLRLLADVWEGGEDPLALQGRVYVRVQGLELGGQLLQRPLPGGVQVEHGRLELELWGDLRKGRLRHLQGIAEAADLRLGAAASPSLHLERFSTRFDWRGTQRGWQLDLDRLALVCDRQPWPHGRLSMAWQQHENGVVGFQLGADYLGLSEVTRLAALLEPLGEVYRQALLALAPSGQLSRFRLALERAPAQAPRWRVSGSVSQYANRPWKSVPGLGGLGVDFQGDQRGGRLRLVSSDFLADMPRLFRDRLTANHLQGRFVWWLHPQTGLRLETDDLYMRTDHVKTLSRMDLVIPPDAENPFIDMQTDFWAGDAAYKGRYLPSGIMPQPLVEWLDRAVVGGHVKAGSMLLYGPLADFPYEHHEGRFEVLFGVEALVLDYMPEWPRLEEVVAEAHFLNNSLSIELFEGKILNSDLQPTQARIRRLKGASPVEISGSVAGPFEDLFRLLQETPLRRQFDRFTDAVEAADGQSVTRLELRIPLQKSDDWRIRGNSDLQQAEIRLEQQGLALRDLQGRLEFDQQKVWGDAIRGRLLEQPVKLRVEPVLEESKRLTRVETGLTIDSEWLQGRFPALRGILRGKAQARLVLSITHAESGTPVTLRVQSELEGMAVELPHPLAKSAHTGREFELVLEFHPQDRMDLHLDYDDLLQAWLHDAGEALHQVSVRLGGGGAERPVEAGIQLQGALERLDLDRWIAWLHARGQAADVDRDTPLRMQLQAQEVTLLGIVWPQLRFELQPAPIGRQLRVLSEDLQGSMTLPRDLQRLPLVVHLERLRLKSADLGPDPRTKTARPPEHDIDPRDLPALDLRVDELWVDRKRLGKALLQWNRSPLGIRLDKLAIIGESQDLKATGEWQKIGDEHITKLELGGHVESLGRLQEGLQLQLGIAKAPLEFKGEFDWPLPPYDLELAAISGSLDLRVGAGEVTDVDPGVGRLVGLLSLHALDKRLSLDFSDLYAKGLIFDRIEGHFELESGDARTDNLILTSPAAQILVSGRTGLADKDYDQLVTVIPRVSSTLPLVGALAVNPTVGVVLAVTQQLFGEQVDRIIQTQYRLSGSWEEPKFEKLVLDSLQEDRPNMMPEMPGD